MMGSREERGVKGMTWGWREESKEEMTKGEMKIITQCRKQKNKEQGRKLQRKMRRTDWRKRGQKGLVGEDGRMLENIAKLK